MSKSLGALVACGNFAFFNEIEKKTPPDHCETGGPSPAKTKAEVVAYLRESFTYAKGGTGDNDSG